MYSTYRKHSKSKDIKCNSLGKEGSQIGLNIFNIYVRKNITLPKKDKKKRCTYINGSLQTRQTYAKKNNKIIKGIADKIELSVIGIQWNMREKLIIQKQIPYPPVHVM